MIPAQELRSAWQLMRPTQWPILSGQLVVGMILVLGPGGAIPGRAMVLAVAWLCWVVLLNGGTLALNSSYDRDTGPVAYLAHPPEPPPWLAAAAVGMMLAGAILGASLVSPWFGALTLGCAVLSWLYSHPQARWKSRPGLDLVVNILGYGAGTTAAGILAGLAATAFTSAPHRSLTLIAVGFGLLFGSFYPLTQIYQHEEDTNRGDRTLATALGVRRSLDLALGLGLPAAAALLWGLIRDGRTTLTVAAALPLVLWMGHLVWLRATWENRDQRGWEKSMYRGLALWALVDAGLVIAWLV